jgi:hypothetical protein
MSSNEIFGSNRFENNPSIQNVVFLFQLDQIEKEFVFFCANMNPTTWEPGSAERSDL